MNIRIAGAFVLAVLACATLPGIARAEAVLSMGLVPGEDPRVMVNDNQALLDHLGKSLQMQVKPFVATDYNGVIEALRSKKLDVALLGPFSYALATTIADVEAFALMETQKQGGSVMASALSAPISHRPCQHEWVP